MREISINGGSPLNGEVTVNGAKNATLPILAATILFESATVQLTNTPQIDDVKMMVDVLRTIGMKATVSEDYIRLDVPKRAELTCEPPESLVSKMRATLLILGAMLSAKGAVSIALPGGCSIGYRPMDLHISALKAMGATFVLEHGIIHAHVEDRLHAAKITLDYPSVGATENIIMAAVFTEGTTIIENAAKEPEVIDLVVFLNNAGANIQGAGSSVIEITGVTQLAKSTEHEVIPDRVEAATYMIAAAATGGNILIRHCIANHLKSIISKMREIGVEIEVEDEAIRVIGKATYELQQSIDIKTAPYPGFHTDVQVLMLPLLLKLSVNSMVIENVFDRRFMHADEFLKIGANISQFQNMLIVNANSQITSGELTANDLRATAAMVLLGVSQPIQLKVIGEEHLRRGYEDLLGNLNKLGADITMLE